ncbi:MAG: AAA family ATPase [Erythrobacter sp.]
MTEQSKITRDDAVAAKDGASLFERASGAFGFDALTSASVPQNLPEVEKRVRKEAPKRDFAPQPDAPIQPSAAHSVPRAPAEQAVRIDGWQKQAIDREQLKESGLIIPEAGVTGLLEEFRIVKRELLADARAGKTAKSRRIQVCSPHPSEGKTYCALNLAIALAAERDLEVLLVDADVVKPKIAQRLGLDVELGLMDALADPQIQPEKLVIETDIDNLFVLPAGTQTARAAEYLASVRTGEVLERLTLGAPKRIVIFDTPPALAASAAAELASYVGQSVLVARADETSRAALEDAQQLLSACSDIKLLLNAVQFSPSGRQFGAYGEQEE